jgi:hypothetical protein|tara:strand:- start:1011 stop:2141 length:1131 start_codon:yes stop_codon:yes gene_type:complete
MKEDVGEMGIKRKSYSKPVPIELYNHFEWKQVDVFVPPNNGYNIPFLGATVSMLAPFHKESGKKAYFFRYRVGRTASGDVRMKLLYDGRQYYNSVVLAYKLFPESDFVEVKDDEVHVLKLLDHTKGFIIGSWNVKIDSKENLRLATLSENSCNSSRQDGSIIGLLFNGPRMRSYYLVNHGYIKEYFSAIEYGGVHHAKLAALKFLKKRIEEKNSIFLIDRLKQIQGEIIKTTNRVKRIDNAREKVYGLSLIRLGNLTKICKELGQEHVSVNKEWVELAQKMKIRNSTDWRNCIKQISTINILNNSKSALRHVDHYRQKFRYKFSINSSKFSTATYSTALEAVYAGLELRQRLCQSLGVEATFHLTEEQIETINSKY